MILIGPDKYRRMPWKNGGGETIEIAISPPGASIDDFDWRISMATVTEPGAFSAFPGVDRTIAILSGEAMRLDIGGESVTLTPASVPFAFPADVDTFGTPLFGPITDLNIMTRRGRFSHAVTHETGAGESTIRAAGSPSLLLAKMPCSAAVGETVFAIQAGATLLIPDQASLSLTAAVAIDCYRIEILPA
jgi:environmental stress-induced protein Ves